MYNIYYKHLYKNYTIMYSKNKNSLKISVVSQTFHESILCVIYNTQYILYYSSL